MPMIPDHYKQLLDPAFIAWLEATHAPLPPGFQPKPEQLRAGFAAQMQPFNGPVDDSLLVENMCISGRDNLSIPLRIYRHRDANNPQPAGFFLHGGGWVVGNLDTHSGLCSDLAMKTGAAVIAIDYRLAPEHIFPAALNDCVDTVRHVHAHAAELGIDATRLAIIGDSAGASLAAGSCLLLRDSDVSLCAQALVYPALASDMDRPSYKENADVPGLSEAEMRFFFISYVGSEILPDPLAAPLAVDDVSGVPDAYITVAQFDPLRDDGIDYASKLKAAGVAVTVRTEPGLGHAYLWVRRTSKTAGDALDSLCAFVREKLV